MLHLREDFDVYLCMQVVRIQVFTVAAKHKSFETTYLYKPQSRLIKLCIVLFKQAYHRAALFILNHPLY